MKLTVHILSSALLTLGLASCGGGDGAQPSNSAGVTSVRVFGDSLADSGTFGIKFTVNNAGPNGTATPIWPELVAKSLGQTTPCNFFTATSFVNFTAPVTTCKNFAVGGAKVNNLPADGGAAAPYSLSYQMDAALQVTGGTLPANELIMIDGGGNDAAAVVGAYLGASPNPSAYMALLSTLIPAQTVNTTIATTNGAAILGGMYMQAAANKLADDITTKLLAHGATKIALVNAPAITNTPRFKSVLGNVSTVSGTSAATAVEGLARQWVQLFNSTLVSRFGSDSRVVIVDLFTEFDNQVTMPAQFNLLLPISPVTGVIGTACPVTGLDAQGLPAYSFATCTAAALDLSSIASTWRNYAFSDGFHPTPYGHVLASQLVNRALLIKGWL